MCSKFTIHMKTEIFPLTKLSLDFEGQFFWCWYFLTTVILAIWPNRQMPIISKRSNIG